MSDIQHQFVKNVLAEAETVLAAEGTAFAPANIALCKYWGKRSIALNLPVNASLSVSLGRLGTCTTVRPSSENRIWLNEHPLPADDPFSARIFDYLSLFRPFIGNIPLEIRTENTIPTGAGLASSASGFAALIMALNAFAGWKLDRRHLSMLARLGSGSAARSVYSGFVLWHAGRRADGLDSFAERLSVDWPAFRIGILELSSARKPVGSREGMLRTAQTSRLYESWPDQAATDLMTIREALDRHDFTALGRAAERNALAMHATMWAAWPPLIYLLPESVQHIHEVQQLRADGLEVYLTIDAGPNLKLLFLSESEAAVRSAFSNVKIINPFEP
jgi:diphosphomevalonate decarboxylase